MLLDGIFLLPLAIALRCDLFMEAYAVVSPAGVVKTASDTGAESRLVLDGWRGAWRFPRARFRRFDRRYAMMATASTR